MVFGLLMEVGPWEIPMFHLQDVLPISPTLSKVTSMENLVNRYDAVLWQLVKNPVLCAWTLSTLHSGRGSEETVPSPWRRLCPSLGSGTAGLAHPAVLWVLGSGTYLYPIYLRLAWDPFLTETSNQQGCHKHTLFVYTPFPHPKLPAPLKPETAQLGLLFSHPSRRL